MEKLGENIKMSFSVVYLHGCGCFAWLLTREAKKKESNKQFKYCADYTLLATTPKKKNECLKISSLFVTIVLLTRKNSLG